MQNINNLRKILKYSLIFLLVLVLVSPNITFAQNNFQEPVGNRPGAGKGTNNPPNVKVNLTQNNTQAAQIPTGNATTGSGYKGLVRCDGVKDLNNSQSRVCNYAALVDTVNYLIDWLLYIAVTLSVLLFMYAGGLYITGVPKNIDKAHDIFKSVVKGLIFMLLAWFIISTLLDWLEVDPSFKALIE